MTKKYLDDNGLLYFFGKLKTLFATKDAATPFSDGLMLSVDKAKLDSLDALDYSGTGTSVVTTNGSYLESAIVDGKAVQNGTPKPSSPVVVEVVEPNGNNEFGIKVNNTLYSIDLQGNVLASLPDGTKDKLNVDSSGHVVLTKHIGVKTLNNTETWSAYSSWNGNGQYCYYTKFNDVYYYHGNIVPLCDFLTGCLRTTFSGSKPINSCAFDTARNLCVRVPYSSKSNFTTWLASNPQKVYYVLDTPITIDLGYIDMPAVSDGDVVSITAQVTPTIKVSWWTVFAEPIANAVKCLAKLISQQQ